MVSFTREFAHLSLKGKHAAQPISTSSPAAAPRRAYTPPRLLENVAEVLRVTSGEPLVVVYFFAQWCGTCKRADPLYAHVSRTYASSSILFTTFDCGGEEEKLSEDTFDLAFVPTWKVWQDGTCVSTIEGDWTIFEPMLRTLVGSPTDEVVVEPSHQAVLDEARLKLAAVSESIKKAKADEARKEARRQARGGESSESDSESGSSDDEEDKGTPA